jgi:uncharacterized protein (TIGR02145 family)
MNTIKSYLIGLAAASLSIAQSYSISGTVKAKTGNGISGAVVRLEMAKDSTVTDNNGKFSFKRSSAIKDDILMHSNVPEIKLVNGFMKIYVSKMAIAEIAVYSVQGKKISAFKNFLSNGLNLLKTPDLGSGLYLYKIKIDNSEYVLVGCSFNKGMIKQNAFFTEQVSISGTEKARNAQTEFYDWLSAKKEGYIYNVTGLNASDTSGIEIIMLECVDTVRDVDGNLYHAVQIGKQVWMVENFRSTKLNDGTSLPEWNNQTTPAYCWPTRFVEDREAFGALYNWYTVKSGKLAPAGWHVPTKAEWDTLENYLIANKFNWDGSDSTDKVAKALAGRVYWYDSDTKGTIGKVPEENNTSGWSGYPAGFCGHELGLYRVGRDARWWGATEGSLGTAYARGLLYNSMTFDDYNFDPRDGNSVRLLKD